MDKIKVLLAITFLSNGRSGTFRGTFRKTETGLFLKIRINFLFSGYAVSRMPKLAYQVLHYTK
jgi:hypothetical protein